MSNEKDNRVTLWWNEGDRMMSRTFKSHEELEEFKRYMPKRKIIGQSHHGNRRKEN